MTQLFDLNLDTIQTTEPTRHQQLAATDLAIGYARRHDCDAGELVEALFMRPTSPETSRGERYKRRKREGK